MPNFRSRRHPIYKLADDLYCEWVTSSDAPGYFYTRADVEALFAAEIAEAEAALEHARGALDRLDANNHTMIEAGPRTVENLVGFNRAGMCDECVSVDELIRYGHDQIARIAASRHE